MSELVLREQDDAGKLRLVVTEEGLAAIERMAAEGNANATIARALGTDARTLRRLRDDDERVAQAYDTGKARLADELTDILLTHARNGNVTAAIYLSKARLGWRDQGPAPQGGNATQINISIPAPMSEEEFRKIVDVKEVKRAED